ncbi:hypothetical protein B0T24DRAFT_198298 [Lasiosphaeria ovina]|uniref:Uncharacterized protein n=1 Tax=Lasiosphaeria ovina TaxID=92902 RepID=A0AAE0TUV7_9PEZI|nr:hypothetical protein B0T24DRAFT_198298 [Lasiosphaeria ovina]
MAKNAIKTCPAYASPRSLLSWASNALARAWVLRRVPVPCADAFVMSPRALSAVGVEACAPDEARDDDALVTRPPRLPGPPCVARVPPRPPRGASAGTARLSTVLYPRGCRRMEGFNPLARLVDVAVGVCVGTVVNGSVDNGAVERGARGSGANAIDPRGLPRGRVTRSNSWNLIYWSSSRMDLSNH